MSEMPSLTAKKIIRALKKVGFIEDRQRGSHLVLVNPGTKARTIIPIHPGRVVKKTLVRAIINDAQLSLDEFVELL